MAHLKIGTFGESQGELAQNTNYLEDGVGGVDPARARAGGGRPIFGIFARREHNSA